MGDADGVRMTMGDNVQFIIIKGLIELANNAFEILFADLARIVVVKELKGPSNLLCGISCEYLFGHYVERTGAISNGS